MRSYLDFEKPVAELEAKVEELRAMQATDAWEKVWAWYEKYLRPSTA